MSRLTTAMMAPPIHSQKLKRLSLGKATSLAPSITGRMKFPRAAGMLGMITRNTMMAPWRVNHWL